MISGTLRFRRCEGHARKIPLRPRHPCSTSSRLLRLLLAVVEGTRRMADLINNAIAALDKKSKQARRAVAGLDTGARLFGCIVLAPIILVGLVYAGIALYSTFGWLAAIPLWAVAIMVLLFLIYL